MEELTEGNYYHIYNRGINSGPLFLEEGNFTFFLEQYDYYSHLSLQTFAYCLMNNHFHFLVKVRSIKKQEQLFSFYNRKQSWVPHGCDYDTFKTQSASRQLAHLFNTYTKNFNRCNQRTGKLFEQPFKRKKVYNRRYLRQLVCYIHRNPVHHKVTKNYEAYPYSSYKLFFSDFESFLEKEKVLNWFGNLVQFKKAHTKMDLNLNSAMQLES